MTARRYEPLLKIASGGTAAVFVGSAVGALGFRQLVAIKRPHAHLADDPAFCAALVEEAKIASKLRHANVVDVRDVEVDETGIQLVMDYVEGASLSELIRGWAKEPPARPEAVALRIVLDACAGLSALHELAGDEGEPLGLVHRDVSPANVLVGLDGVARIADFGLAKPLLSVDRTTSEGTLRGKLGYMAPEYIRGKGIDRRIDVFAMGIVLWEALARQRLFRGDNDGETLDRVQQMEAPALAKVAPHLGAAAVDLDAVVARALAKDPEKRLATMDALAAELAKVARTHDLGATHGDVRDSFAPAMRADLDDRRRRVQAATAQSVSASGTWSASGVASTPGASQPPPSVSVSASRPPPSVSVSQPAPAVAPSQPPAALASHTPPALVSSPAREGSAARARPAPRALVAAAAFGVVLVIGAVAVGVTRRTESAPARDSAARAVASEVEPLSGDVRARAASSSAEEPTAAAATTASSRGSHAGARPVPRPTSAEPGKKPPRPNPYASGASPR
jgi:serine/threonine-protein kinase